MVPSRRRLEPWIVVGLGALAATAVSWQSGLVVWWWAGVLVPVVRRLFGADHCGRALTVYGAYVLLAVALFLAQLWTNPVYYGFSGGHGVGTDDSYFYSLVARDLPGDFPYRFGVYQRGHNYADLLKVVAWGSSTVFRTLHPLDLIAFNAFGLTLLPLFTGDLARRLLSDERAARVAFLVMATCPFVLSNGVILIRDGWVAALFAGCLWALVASRRLLAVVALAGTAYLRLGTGVMLLFSAGLVAAVHHGSHGLGGRRMAPGRWRRIALVTVTGLVAAAVLVPAVTGFRWWEHVFRAGFLREMLGMSARHDSGTSTFYAISQLPVIVRVPLAFFFFLGSPFLSLKAVVVEGLWVPRAFLANAFGLLFPVYAAWFLRGVLRALRERHVVALTVVAVLVLDVIAVSQASMQLRHKIPLQFLFYVVVAYGAVTPYRGDRALGWLAALAVVAADVAVNLLQFRFW